MKRYFFCISFTPTAYATNDTTIIHHVYKPDFAIKSVAMFCLVFFQVNGYISLITGHIK